MDATANDRRADLTGFIGLGNMGAPMARRLLEAGVPLIVHDVRAAATAPLEARGARVAASPQAVADAAKTVITIVPSSRDVTALVDAMLPSLTPGHLLIEMTTSDPSVTRALAARVAVRGAALVDAPVSGGVKGAVEGSLAIMIGGEAVDVVRARPLLTHLGTRLFHVGGVSAGHAMKLVNNVTSAACLMATAEAVAVAMRAGIDPACAVDVIAASSGRSNASDWKFPRFILSGRFDSGFALALMRKDVDGFLRLAEEMGVDAPVATAAADYFRRAMQTPLASADHTEVVTLLGEGFAPAKETDV
jgi:3-hydroxyisobutyrate dehydrogenase